MENSSLAITLSAAVPIRIMALQARGGPTDSDFERMADFGEVLASKGDVLLFGSKKPGEAADLFNRMAEAIAVLSFCPGGITVFGQHWESVRGAGY